MTLTNILMEMGIDKSRAETAKIPEGRFYDVFGELEILLGGTEHGFEHALDVFSNGEILDYHQVKLDEYLKLARIVAGKIGYNVNQRQIFYSVDSLKNYLDGPQEQKLDFSRLRIERYRILHNNPQSIRYLRELIKSNELTTGDHEHWKKERSMCDGGARGVDICKDIGRQINKIYDDLGLPRPGIVINHGQRRIIINEETRELLRQIKNYKEQNL